MNKCKVVFRCSIRLGVDKYISEPEQNGSTPSRSLVSLDITNMFNSVSREKCREIIATEFPELQAFADMLYQEEGRTLVRKDDGSWEVIPVREGFSQGCPVSPLFAALVLNHILSKVNSDLIKVATRRKNTRNNLDDNKGGIPLILAYVDDVNALIPNCDVQLFLDLFKKYGEPLGALLNTEKTRILTSTSSTPTTEKLLHSGYASSRTIGNSLTQAIATYSKDKDGSPIKLTEGIRVLGSPVGSTTFCKQFIQQILDKVKADSDILIH